VRIWRRDVHAKIGINGKRVTMEFRDGWRAG
jgi:hypothetical protein